MNPEGHNVAYHGGPSPQLLREAVCSLSHTRHNQKFRRDGEFLVEAPLTYSRTARSRFAALLRTLSTSSLSVASAWGRSCLGIYRGTPIPRAKPSDRMVEQPTQWSKPSSQTSPTRFGLRTLRLRSPRFVAAAFVPRSAISADNENGRVSPSPSSSPRSCVATPCETSRSFPGGNHRPF